MGIFSFFTGDNRNSEAVDPNRETPDRGSLRDGGTERAATPEVTAPGEPDGEPGAGIVDFEPIVGSRPDRDEAGDVFPGPSPPDWWRSAPGAPPPSPAGSPELDAGAWNMGALLEPPARSGPQIEVGPADPRKTLELKPRIVDALSTVYDPEIPINIYELGLIYEIVIDAKALVLVRMTLTSPACPSAQQLPGEVQYKVKAVAGVTDAAVEVVWEPPWTKDMMSDAAKLSLGIW